MPEKAVYSLTENGEIEFEKVIMKFLKSRSICFWISMQSS